MRKAAAQKPLDFSQANYHLTQGYPHIFHGLFHHSKEQELAGNNNFHLRRRLHSFEEVYFKTS